MLLSSPCMRLRGASNRHQAALWRLTEIRDLLSCEIIKIFLIGLLIYAHWRLFRSTSSVPSVVASSFFGLFHCRLIMRVRSSKSSMPNVEVAFLNVVVTMFSWSLVERLRVWLLLWRGMKSMSVFNFRTQLNDGPRVVHN